MRPPSNVYDVSNVLCVVYLHIGETTVTRQSAFFLCGAVIFEQLSIGENALYEFDTTTASVLVCFFSAKPCLGHFTVINIKIPNTY